MCAPLFLANSISSRIIIPAPSPITKPSLFLSHGLDDSVGLSLNEVLKLLAALKPAMPSLHTAASEPPAIITSAAPRLIISPESPLE